MIAEGCKNDRIGQVQQVPPEVKVLFPCVEARKRVGESGLRIQWLGKSKRASNGCGLLLFSLLSSVLIPWTNGQDVALPSTVRPESSAKSAANSDVQGPITVRALKPKLPKAELLKVDKEGRPAGVTMIAADPKVEQIIRGGEPKTLQDLLALEEQQAKVATKIQGVTVHIEQGSAQGSGVIITPDGYVLTAAHVAGKPNRDTWIRLSSGRRVRGKTLGMNRYMDAGLIKITESVTEPWPHASLGTSSLLRPGHWVIASGHPGGWSKDRPAVFRVGRILETMPSTLVTDCPLIGGDSGGPLFDFQGKLIGIHSRIGTDIGDNMHVPIDIFSDSWDRMARSEAWGTLPGYKPMIGVKGNNESSKPIVAEIMPNSPAAEAGLRVGDLIRKFDGISLNSFADLQSAVESSLPQDRVKLEVERDGKVIELRVVVGLQ